MASRLHINVWQKQISCKIKSNKLHLFSTPIKNIHRTCLGIYSSSRFISGKTTAKSQRVGKGLPANPSKVGSLWRWGRTFNFRESSLHAVSLKLSPTQLLEKRLTISS